MVILRGDVRKLLTYFLSSNIWIWLGKLLFYFAFREKREFYFIITLFLKIMYDLRRLSRVLKLTSL